MKNLSKTLAASLGYLALAVACLVRPGAEHPLARLDWFAGGYLALRFAGALHSIVSSQLAFRSKSLREEWWGQSTDPVGPRWVMLLMAIDLLTFLDYGHWRLTPWLAQPSIQWAGLVLYLLVMLSQIWTDSYLSRYFESTKPQEPMRAGPYKYIRHPRYGAAIVGKIAMAMVFGSAFAWLSMLGWTALMFKQVELEELHLRKLFGAHYDTYARSTAKLVPGLY